MKEVTSKELEFDLEYPITEEIHNFVVNYTVTHTLSAGTVDEYGNVEEVGDTYYKIDSIVMIDEDGKEFDYSDKEDVIKEANKQIEIREL